MRRSIVHARGVRFHVTEAGGGADDTPVLLLHGWPQHHDVWRDLLADPPAGARIIAPDLPGYGWSGAPPHRWRKDEVARDVLALLEELGLERVILAGHDWGGYIGFLMALERPDRVAALLALNVAHPWQTPRTLLPHLWRFAAYQPALAVAGRLLVRRTRLVERVVLGTWVTDRTAASARELRRFAARLRDPVCARATVDTYRTLWLRELPAAARHPERRSTAVPIHALFGRDDFPVHRALASPSSARADDYVLELVDGCGHFIVDERPDLVRDRLVELVRATPAQPPRSRVAAETTP